MWVYEQAGVDYGPGQAGLIPVPGYKVVLASDSSTVIAFTRSGVIEDPSQPGQYIVPSPPGVSVPVWAPHRIYWSRNGGTSYDRSEPIGPVELGSSGEYNPPAPPDPLKATGSLLVLDKNQQPVDGIPITFQMITLPASEIGVGYLSKFIYTSAGGGHVDAFFPRGTDFRARRGTGPWVSFTVPDQDNFSLPDILGVV